MTIKPFALVGLLAILGGSACSPSGADSDRKEPDRPAHKGGAEGTSADAGPSKPAGGTLGGTPEGTDDAAKGDGSAMIVKTERRVFLKRREAADFIPIRSHVGFHPGDLLRVEEQARAFVLCRHICVLEKGEYHDCCTSECRRSVDLSPDDERTTIVARTELPPPQARSLAESEAQIARLGLDETTAQFLRANLYVNWKLSEAPDEVQKLSNRLDKPDVRRKLRDGYAPMMRRTGDLFHKINLRDKAIDRYKKATELAPAKRVRDRAAAEKDLAAEKSLAAEKAQAHSRLADVYVEAGNKREAIENLDRAREIYRIQGDVRKIREADRKIEIIQGAR